MCDGMCDGAVGVADGEASGAVFGAVCGAPASRRPFGGRSLTVLRMRAPAIRNSVRGVRIAEAGTKSPVTPISRLSLIHISEPTRPY